MSYAKLHDNLLQIGIFPDGILNIITIIILTLGNTIGTHYSGSSLLIIFDGYIKIQIDGNLAVSFKAIKIKLLKKALKIIF